MNNNNLEKDRVMVERAGREQPYTLYFFILSMIIIALSIWVIWFETVQLRPWKAYQKQYYQLKQEQLEKEYDKALAEYRSPEIQGRRTELDIRLKNLIENLQRAEVQREYKKTEEDLEDIRKELLDNRAEFRAARGKFLELEYLYYKHQREEDKARIEELRGDIAALENQRESLQDREDSLALFLSGFTEESEEVAAELEFLESPVKESKQAFKSLDDIPIEIKQIYMQDINKADRCQSCHIGIDSPDRVSNQHPYTQHPAGYIYLENHSVNEFGCTFCHRGQGRATSSPDKGHGWVEHWEGPMLVGNMTQATCENCHGDIRPLKGGDLIARGSELVEKYGCYGCHQTAGYEDLRKVGPDLTEVGLKVNFTWLANWIQNPKQYFEAARMPKFFFSQKEAESIADYLFSMTQEFRADESTEDIDWDLADTGKALWRKSRCSICHATGGVGGAHREVYAPDLGKVGSKVNRDWLFRWIKDPRKHFPTTRMPRFRFSDEQIRALVEFVIGEYINWDFEPQYTDSVPIDVESIIRGKELIQKYGCFGCHNVKGMEEMKKIGPFLRQEEVSYLRVAEVQEKIGSELSSIGSKPLEQFDFGKMAEEIPHDRISYLQQKLKDPRSFRDDLRMPNFQFSEEETEALAVLLVGFTDISIPTRFKIPKEPVEYQPVGEVAKIMDDVKCLNCHRIKGNGADFAPDLSIEGSKVQERWLRDFLKQPDIIRPMLKQMPRFNLDYDQQMMQGNLTFVEIETLVRLFKQVMVSKDIPETLPESDLSLKEQVDAGKELYDGKGCEACHQIAGAGGAVGPSLTNVGNRLTEGYIYKHLENPRALTPDIVEPDYGFTEEERINLTRYMMSLRQE